MSETRKSEGRLVTLENVTAASNLVAGAMVAVSGTGTLVYTLSSGTTGLGVTASMSQYFLGVLDEAVSAGQSPITVWTEGVFQFELASASISGRLYPGNPVWASDSGTHGREVITVGQTGQAAIGTLVGMNTWGETGGFVQVKINPAAYRWTVYVPAATATALALPLQYPAAGW